ncbi:hypothetical protein [Glaciimonas immobilis]|uniref:Uncharacterized protein n=1 Tax=Glaciimonas immobilis TaxID=728004 RepID=A0A840RVR1_9BURK|nr:hypothetical protein [Glaciimonas immobilis]KAF3997642.1 hypothetical protein HAV38_13340 [Glaciimonas immobilis]MBB5200651.1 hypothetical protein [Glaciimonas immobilis]
MPATTWLKRWLIAVAMTMMALPALAFDRTFPATTLRGNMTITAYPAITVGKATLQLSPGSRIWGQNHLTQIPVSLGSSTYLVNYTQNFQGDVDRVWILTTDEASQSIETQRSNLK